MAKNSIRDYDATAANNTDIQSVDVSEGCPASGINNALREIMADIKDVSAGTVALESPQADSLTVTGDLTVDTDTLVVDAANNKVGMGTTSGSGQVTIEGAGSTRQLVITDDDVERLQLYHVGNNSTIESSSSGSNSTNLIFKTSSSGTEAERLRIQSGGGISFNGDTAADNALSDFETGSWTPTIGAGTINTIAGSAKYTKIGNVVTVIAIIQDFSDRTSGTHVSIGGLPYSTKTSTNASSSVLGRYMNTGGDSIILYTGGGASAMTVWTTLKGGNYAAVYHSNLNSNQSNIFVNHTYLAN